MNKPVLLPKRHEYGFLKPPSTPSQSVVYQRMLKGRSGNSYKSQGQPTNRTNNTQNTKLKERQSSRTYNEITELHPFYADSSTSGIDYTFDVETLKYDMRNTTTPMPFPTESKSAPIHRTMSHPNNQDYYKNALKSSFNTNKAFGYSYRKKMKSFTDRKAYTNEKGTNFPNQHRQHHLLAIPFNRMNSADFHISPDHVTNGEPVTNSVGGFAASRLLVKREKSKLNNCTKCGKIYNEFRCLNCEFNKRKFQFNWQPMMLKTKEILQKNRATIMSLSSATTNPANVIERSLSLNSNRVTNKLNTIVKENMVAKNIDTLPRTADSAKKTPFEASTRFEEFDMSFKFDVDAIMKQKAEEHKLQQAENEKTPKLTLYLL